jgi:hypothetical protein
MSEDVFVGRRVTCGATPYCWPNCDRGSKANRRPCYAHLWSRVGVRSISKFQAVEGEGCWVGASASPVPSSVAETAAGSTARPKRSSCLSFSTNRSEGDRYWTGSPQLVQISWLSDSHPVSVTGRPFCRLLLGISSAQLRQSIDRSRLIDEHLRCATLPSKTGPASEWRIRAKVPR